MRDSKRDLLGKTPGASFSGQDYSPKMALVTRVDPINLKVDLRLLSGAASDWKEVPITQGMSGPRSFWGGIPEEGSIALVVFRLVKARMFKLNIIGFLPAASKSGLRWDPITADDPSNIDPESLEAYKDLFGDTKRPKRLMLGPGDQGGMSSSGAEFTLTKDVSFINRAGDLFELRDADRTAVQSSLHRVQTEGGIRRVSGPLRRSAIFLPSDILVDGILRSPNSSDPYYGRDELQAAGPGTVNAAFPRFANSNGQLLGVFSSEKTLPPITYANGKSAYYPPTVRGENVDDPSSGSDVYVEDRVELFHTTDLVQEVLEEIDGFSSDRRVPFIEEVRGTVVGNDLNTTEGQRNYGQILKPRLFTDFNTHGRGQLKLEPVDRNPSIPDIETNTVAAASMFRLRSPYGSGGVHTHIVDKQGKVLLDIPGSVYESSATGSKNISMEANLLGALKAFIGSSSPDGISVHATLAGGVHLDIGHDSKGNAVTVQYHSGIKTIADGNPNADDVAVDQEVRGVKRSRVTGKQLSTVDGTRKSTVSGQDLMEADRLTLSAFSGYNLTAGELTQMVSGKTQLNYALQVQETIVAGGRLSTIVAGGDSQTILAGAKSTTVLAGATSFSNPAGAFNISVGAGAFNVSVAGGAINMSSAVGAVSVSAPTGLVAMTAGLALNLTAGVAVNIVAPQVLVGGPAAVLGVCRGTPTMPPGSPSLDILTGLPLFGSAVFRSI